MSTCIKCEKPISPEALFCSFCGKKQHAEPIGPSKSRRRAKGSGNVRKHSGPRRKPYEARITEFGKQTSLGMFKTREEAQTALITYRGIGLDSDIYNMTLGQIYKYFLDTTQPGTQKMQHYSAAWLKLSIIKNIKIRDLTTADFQHVIKTATKEKRYKQLTEQELAKKKPSVREYYKQLMQQPEQPLSREGKLQIKSLASLLCKCAMSLKLMDKNYAALVTIASEPPVTEKKNFTSDDIKLIFANDKSLAAKIILLYTYTGFRANELLNLTKENVNLTDWYFTGGSKTEAGKNRVVPILPFLRPYVLYFYNLPGDMFITETNGLPVSYRTFLEKMFYPFLESLSIPCTNQAGKHTITPHRMRHTVTQLAVAAGVSPEALKSILGHSKYETTMEKYHNTVDPDYLRKEFEKIVKPG